MKIGVFDSGVGGRSVAAAIKRGLPEHEIVLREDRQHVPYGLKQPAELLSLVEPILQKMVDEGCQVIVIACNTVTTTIITELRKLISVPLVAVEPMVKPAAELTKSGVIAVCATPTTLASSRYRWLKQTYAPDVTVLEPDCGDWAAMIEAKSINLNKLEERISEVIKKDADVIVLGCTHYHWIEEEIRQLAAGHAQVLQPEAALIKQLKRVIKELN